MAKRRVQATVISETPFQAPSTQVNPLAALALINALNACPATGSLAFPAAGLATGLPAITGFPLAQPFFNPIAGLSSPLLGFGASSFNALPTTITPFGSPVF